MRPLALALLALAACGSPPQDDGCSELGSMLDPSTGACVSPVFTRSIGGPSALSDRCPFDQTSTWPDCAVCHKVGSPVGGMVQVHPLTPAFVRPTALTPADGCTICHRVGP